MKRVLVLFERSGAVSVPFRNAGFDVITVDIEPHLVDNEHHIIADLSNLDNLKLNYKDFDLLIAFPPCTYFSQAGLWRMNYDESRKEKQLRDLEMIKSLWALPIKCKCFENPRGSALKKLWKKPSCTINYCEYDVNFHKFTYLWLEGLPPLLPDFYNKSDYGSFIESLSPGFKRSITPQAVGCSMVKQWQYFI